MPSHSTLGCTAPEPAIDQDLVEVAAEVVGIFAEADLVCLGETDGSLLRRQLRVGARRARLYLVAVSR